MVLTNKQRRAIANAPPQDRRKLQQSFSTQNKTAEPSHDTAARRRANARRATVQRMPAPAHTSSRDITAQSWSQTPASSNVIAPRKFGFYDAFAHNPDTVATHMSVGPATPIVGTTTITNGLVTDIPTSLDTGYEANMKLLIVNPNPSAQQAVLWYCSDQLGSSLAVNQPYVSSQLLSDPPQDAIVTRQSLRIRNWTQLMAQGGVIRVLRMTTGVHFSHMTTNQEIAQFCENIRDHARTRTYCGTELNDAMQKNATVVDATRSMNFKGWNEFYSHPDESHGGFITSTTFEEYLADPAFTPIAILFEPFVAAIAGSTAVGNSYEVVLRSQFLAHYRQGTMLANMAITAPTAPEALTRARDHEESSGSTLHPVGKAIWNGAAQLGNFAWNNRDNIRHALGFVAKKLPLALT